MKKLFCVLVFMFAVSGCVSQKAKDASIRQNAAYQEYVKRLDKTTPGQDKKFIRANARYNQAVSDLLVGKKGGEK